MVEALEGVASVKTEETRVISGSFDRRVGGTGQDRTGEGIKYCQCECNVIQ
jgi:hypothetical protein